MQFKIVSKDLEIMNKGNMNNKSPVALKIIGHVLSKSYQKCKLFAEKLKKHYGSELKEVSVQGLLEVDWADYLRRLQRTVGGQTWAVAKGVVVFVDGVFVGADRELFDRFKPLGSEIPTARAIDKLAREDYLRRLNRSDVLFVFFELSLDDEHMGTMLFELRYDLLPETSAWFAKLSDPKNTLGYGYEGSLIHRVCRSGWMQGGDLSGVHLAHLHDESFCYKHDRRGVLSFANGGRHSNYTQFVVTFQPAAWMDERFVAFGRLVEGSDVLRRIEHASCTYEAPDRRIRIERCGVAEVGLGRHFVTHRLQMKGLTQGQPHIDPHSFVELLFDSVRATLFERLDDAVKRDLHAEWLASVLWDRVLAALADRLPLPDVPDSQDRSSQLEAARYLAGLYGLPDIPDHFILRLLRRAVERAADRGDVIDMVRGIVGLLVDAISLSVFDDGTSAEIVAENIVNILVYEVERIVFRTDELIDSSKNKAARNSSDTLPLSYSSYTLDTRRNVKFGVNSYRSSTSVSSNPRLIKGTGEDNESNKELVIGYIWETLFDSLNQTTD